MKRFYSIFKCVSCQRFMSTFAWETMYNRQKSWRHRLALKKLSHTSDENSRNVPIKKLTSGARDSLSVSGIVPNASAV